MGPQHVGVIGSRSASLKMDDIDRAQALTERERESLMERRRMAAKPRSLPLQCEGKRCVGCDAEIPLARLSAMPEARRCVSCQSAAEVRDVA